MQQLHLVGFTTDHDSLIFSGRKGAKSGGFVLPLDEALLATIADAVRRRIADGEELEVPPEILAPAAPAPRRQSQLSPREIQDRLRAGRSLEAIAAEAGVGEEWVARFAAPVEAERSQIVGRARELVYAKPRRGESAEVLGLAVRWNLADRGVRLTNDEYDAGWSAYQVADHSWMVTFTFVSRNRRQEAEWEVDLATGELVSRNRLASDLGYVEPGRRRRSMASLQPVPLLGTKGARRPGAPTSPRSVDVDDADTDAAVPPSTGRTSTAKRSTGRSPAKAAAAKRPASGRAAAAGRKVAVAKAAAGGRAAAPAKKAPATKAPATKASAKKASAKKASARKASATKTAGKRAGSASGTATARAAGSQVRTAKVIAKQAPARRAVKQVPASRTAAPRKAPAVAKRAARPSRPTASRRRSGGAAELPPAVAVAIDRPEPNELGQRRLQLATGAPRPTDRGRRPSPQAAVAAPTGSPPGPGAGVRTAPPRSPDAGSRRQPASPAAAPRSEPDGSAAPPETPAPAPARRASASPERPASAPAPLLDVDDEASSEARRAERRRARAEARAAGEATASPVADPGPHANTRPPTRGAAPADVPPGDGRVVTIRADRASPPRADGDDVGEVIVPGDRPPLRPALPATQPRRRRFGRSG